MKKILGIIVLGLFLQGCGNGIMGATFTTDKNRYFALLSFFLLM